jgi:isoamylase
VLGPMEQGQAPIFIVLNAAPEEIAFKMPRMSEYRSWRQVLNTAVNKQVPADFAAGADSEAPPRAVLAFAGSV